MAGVARHQGAWLLTAGFVVAALNLRPALAGVSPLLPAIMRDLGLGAAAGGAITTVMVACLGLLAPAAPVLARRVGLDRTLLIGLLVLATGVAVRSADGPATLYGGAALAGAAIAVMNVVMPGLVKQHFPGRIGLFTGLYVGVMVGGAATASAAVVPLSERTGWRIAAGSAAVLALVAAGLWAAALSRQAQSRPARPETAGTGPAEAGPVEAEPAGTGVGTEPAGPPNPGRPTLREPGSAPAGSAAPPASRPASGGRPAAGPYRALLRTPATWAVTAFMGLQSLTFYVMLAWLPTIFQAAGLPAARAGYLLGLTNLVQIAAALAVPLHAGRARSRVPHVVVSTLLTIAGYLGVLLAPTTVPWLWMIVLGLGQGAAIALALLIITLRAPDPASVTALSAVAQSSGYVLAALGPIAVGVLHEASGGWTVPLLAGLGACVVQLAAGVLAAR